MSQTRRDLTTVTTFEEKGFIGGFRTKKSLFYLVVIDHFVMFLRIVADVVKVTLLAQKVEVLQSNSVEVVVEKKLTFNHLNNK